MNMEHTIAQQVARPVALHEHKLTSAVKPDRTRDQELFPRDGDQKEKCGKEEGLQERLHHQGRYFVSRSRIRYDPIFVRSRSLRRTVYACNSGRVILTTFSKLSPIEISARSAESSLARVEIRGEKLRAADSSRG